MLSMRVAAHITYFANQRRIKYLIETVRGLLEIPGMDIFVHTNDAESIALNGLHHTVVEHDLTNTHPYYLAAKSRKKIAELADSYDYTVYIEDDIRFGLSNFEYYLRHHSLVKQLGLYISFLRVERREEDNVLKLTDVTAASCCFPRELLAGKSYFRVPATQYCAMWILDRDELSSFIENYPSVFWLESGLHDKWIREHAALGPIYSFYKACLYADEPGLFIHHIPNNYANDAKSQFGKVDVTAVSKNDNTVSALVI